MDIVDGLATVYTGLAACAQYESGAVRTLDDDADAVASLQRALRHIPGASGAVSDAVVMAAFRRAHQAVASGRHNTDMLVAVQELRDTLANAALNGILAELVVCALRDDRFEPEESRLIGAIRRSWNIDPSHGQDDSSTENDDRLWSVLGDEGAAPTNWTVVHDLALVYLSVAHRSDGELSRTEVDAITRKLGEWLPSALPADVLNVVDEALRRYADGQADDTLTQSVDRIVAAVPEHQRDAVLRDLVFVAEADNVVLVEEKQLISAIATRWGIDIR